MLTKDQTKKSLFVFGRAPNLTLTRLISIVSKPKLIVVVVVVIDVVIVKKI